MVVGCKAIMYSVSPSSYFATKDLPSHVQRYPPIADRYWICGELKMSNYYIVLCHKCQASLGYLW